MSNQTGCEHHFRVGSIGAGGDGSDGDIAVLEVESLAIVFHSNTFITDGGLLHGFERFEPFGLHVGEVDAVLGSLGTRECGDDGGHVQLKFVGVDRLVVIGSPQAVGFAVLFDGGDEFFITAGELQVFEGLFVDGEEAHGRAIFGSHVGDGRAVGKAHVG